MAVSSLDHIDDLDHSCSLFATGLRVWVHTQGYIGVPFQISNATVHACLASLLVAYVRAVIAVTLAA